MKKITLLLVAVISSFCLFAQRHSSYIISYPVSIPLSDVKDYVGETSFRGISMEFNKEIRQNVEVGFEAAWHVFNERVEDKAYTNETASISGVQYRYINIIRPLTTPT